MVNNYVYVLMLKFEVKVYGYRYGYVSNIIFKAIILD
jgi:hypothetical protein